MKTLFTLILIVSAHFSFSQTAVIAMKSHSGNMHNTMHEPDNFGEIAPIPEIDSVIRVSETCILEIGTRWGTERYRDTICDHWAFKLRGYSKSVVTDVYGESPTIIGFEESVKSQDDNDSWNMGQPKQNGGLWLILIIGSILLFTLAPILKRTKS